MEEDKIKARTSLVIDTGDDLPDVITDLLSITPDKSHRKGEKKFPHRPQRWKSCEWRLEIETIENYLDFDKHASYFINKIGDKIDVLKSAKIGGGYKVYLYVVISSKIISYGIDINGKMMSLTSAIVDRITFMATHESSL